MAGMFRTPCGPNPQKSTNSNYNVCTLLDWLIISRCVRSGCLLISNSLPRSRRVYFINASLGRLRNLLRLFS